MKQTLLTIAITLFSLTSMAQIASNMKAKKIVQTAGRDALGEFAPKFAEVNDDVLFGEVWSRNDLLSLRDRSIVTIVALMSQGLTDSSFRHHLETAKKNGVTKTEIAEVLTHAAFYAGWPKAWAAFNIAKEIWTDSAEASVTKEDFETQTLWPIGNPNDAYAKYFIGQSYTASLDAEYGGPINVTFEPRCRNNWHVHHGQTQVLVCVAGHGWYQEWGKAPKELKPGMVIAIPAETKHWHGAQADSWFQHLTYHTNVKEVASNEWLEPVDDKTYNALSIK